MNAITVENISKRYLIDHRARADTLRDALTQGVRGLWGRLRQGRLQQEEFWALRDINLEVKPGEVLGIIGRNGAGKSTLLKILSRITEPTTGRIQIRGRVASLLEVGTGFHPELSGRENIFLNGAILGMSRAEVARKFDEIVAFAEIERFLDTPVKRYSSGMYVRLAFAVAAHLEPEILIVDEVLAVGDVAFQKKCLGKMKSVAGNQGRTVLFVSHNLHAVQNLCSRGMLLGGGRLVAAGTTSETVAQYTRAVDVEGPAFLPAPSPQLLHQGYVIGAVVESAEGRTVLMVRLGIPWQVRITIRLNHAVNDLVVAIGFASADGIGVQTAWAPPQALEAGDYEYVFTQNQLVLAAGSYSVLVGLSEGDHTFQQVSAARVEVSAEQPRGYFPVPSGAGFVLNSMSIQSRRL